MDKKEIIEKLTPIVRDVFADSTIQIMDEMDAENVEAWTSLSFMQLLARIEEEFCFKFKIFELISIHNMGELVAAIGKHCE